MSILELWMSNPGQYDTELLIALSVTWLTIFLLRKMQKSEEQFLRGGFTKNLQEKVDL